MPGIFWIARVTIPNFSFDLATIVLLRATDLLVSAIPARSSQEYHWARLRPRRQANQPGRQEARPPRIVHRQSRNAPGDDAFARLGTRATTLIDDPEEETACWRRS